MIANEEPQYTEIANVQMNANSHKLPEMPRLPDSPIPRTFDVDHLIKTVATYGDTCCFKYTFYWK